jgi:DNA-binding response OmpR family regulator
MKKILLVEDESALQKTLGEVLGQEGYEIFSALNGEVGLRMAKDIKPDLILLDLILPKLHGFEVLKGLKGNEETKGIPVIVLTNLESMADIEKAIELGAKGYLVKAQYSLEEIVKKVKEVFPEEL